jgi:hypothetical protein
MVVLKVIASASPRISGNALDFEDVDGLMVRNVSRRVCIWNVPGVSAVGIERKDSRGDTASVLADNIPNLSQLRYLRQKSARRNWGGSKTRLLW